ncbi:MAG: hypothetical protein P8013_10225 [Candidatus Sulfobium sp.]|jgi:hypothetical protein
MKGGKTAISKSSVSCIAAAIFFLIFSIPAFASKDTKDRLYENNGRADICRAVEVTIEQGINDREVVSTAIELGNKPCLVVKCAIDGGGNLKEIISGALEAGTTSDVVSRCAVDAGVNSVAVAASLQRAGVSLSFFETEHQASDPPENTLAPFDPIPKPNPDPPISPSTF